VTHRYEDDVSACARRHPPVSSNVFPSIPRRPRAPAPQSYVQRRLLSEHRSSQPDQLQHSLCAQDTDDDQPGNCSTPYHDIYVGPL